MIKDIIEHTASSIYAQVGLVIFVLLFSAITIWTYSGRKNRFDRASRLPLEDDAANQEPTDTHNH
jgi:cbb3-type cytochrome oxidase subunit 3